jgi:recombination protein RecA
MKESLRLALAAINKKDPNTIGAIADMEFVKVERITTGSHYLDYALGGGWPLGRIVELYGHPSSGKSMIATKTVAEAQKLGKDCVYLDCENAFDPDYARQLGVDIDKLILYQGSGGEATFDLIFTLVDNGADVIVVDSVASMVPNAEFAAEMQQQSIALSARLMSKGLRVLGAHQSKTKALVIFINQIRMTPGAYGNPETTSGGKALGFYSSVRLEVRRGDFIEEGTGANKDKVGQVVKFKVTKNKVAAPFKTGYFKFLYEGTIDRVDELVSLGLDTKKIAQRGAYYDFAGKTFKGRADLEAQLSEDKKLYDALAKEVLK